MEKTGGYWVERAEKATCVALRREIESLDQKQMCALGEFDLHVPRRVAELLDAAFRAVRDGLTWELGVRPGRAPLVVAGAGGCDNARRRSSIHSVY